MTGCWVELADGVLARRYAELDLTVGLVLGTERALVIDTRGDRAQGAELAEAVRARTPLPVTVVLTHAHFDHCFGTSAFLDRAFVDRAFQGSPVYAHPGCARALAGTAESQRAEWIAYYRDRGDDDTATALAASVVVAPDTLVERTAELDLGGRVARLLHPGPGHTDHDLAVAVPDARVVFAGDLVEQGAPPDFGDAHPLRWPAAVGALQALGPDIVVPGHGDPVPPSFVAAQRAELAAVADLCRTVATGARTEPEALAASPYPPATTRAALARARVTG